ncbi:MAG TPA: DDE transposase [Clostridiales bacterium]|nr:DDE transposase [Clostridiales bacterium]
MSRFRARLYEYEQQTGIDLMKEEMESLADAFVQMMGLSGQTKRMDSLMVASSCKRMRRLELFYSCVSRMVKAIRATGLTELLDKRLRKYLDANDENDTLYRTPASEVDSKLEAAMTDAVRLLELTGEAFAKMAEYQQLKRLVEEQTEDTGHGRKLRDKSKISPNSLQNPSDEDATFRTKAGETHKGYVGNLVETFDGTGAVITRMDYQQNTHSDMSFGLAVIAAEESQATQAVTLIADGAYGSDELLMAPAGEKKVRLVATNLTGKAPDPVVSQFAIDEQRKILVRCPAGHTPTDSHYRSNTDSCFAHFNKGVCSKCPLRQHCGVKFQKKTGLVRVALKTIHRAQYLVKLGQTEFKKLTRQRNALEGVPSVSRRKYDVDHMPVRGYVRTKLWFFLKVGAVNARRIVEWAAQQADSLLFQTFCVNLNFSRRKNRLKSNLIVSAVI